MCWLSIKIVTVLKKDIIELRKIILHHVVKYIAFSYDGKLRVKFNFILIFDRSESLKQRWKLFYNPIVSATYCIYLGENVESYDSRQP